MKKMILLFIALISMPVFSANIHGELKKLYSLKCVGKNGVTIEYQEESSSFVTKLYSQIKQFGSSGKVLVYGLTDNSTITRVVLQSQKYSNIHMYEIYLSGQHNGKKPSELKGYIGNDINTVIFPLGIPAIYPVGFIPITMLNCEILTD